MKHWKPQQPSPTQAHETKQVLSWGRVLLLGIAQRRVSFKRNQTFATKSQPKSLQESIQTIGDWIKFYRGLKNLTHWHLGAKMGIAHAVIRSWESGEVQPSEAQMTDLEAIFGVRWKEAT